MLDVRDADLRPFLRQFDELYAACSLLGSDDDCDSKQASKAGLLSN
jgi:hypothetical protein